jgi:frataxin
VSRSSRGLRCIHTTSTRTIAILEDRDDNKPKASEHSPVSVAASDITEAEYHQLADEYLETLLGKFEELQDAREDVDVEFSVRS